MSATNLPTVSICTPTKDRTAVLPLLLRCIQQQDYPASLIEWVVVDDGVQSAEAICCEFANTRYIRLDPTLGQVPLGRKRNLCHQTGTGEIFLYMDDDDYYPPHGSATRWRH